MRIAVRLLFMLISGWCCLLLVLTHLPLVLACAHQCCHSRLFSSHSNDGTAVILTDVGVAGMRLLLARLCSFLILNAIHQLAAPPLLPCLMGRFVGLWKAVRRFRPRTQQRHGGNVAHFLKQAVMNITSTIFAVNNGPNRVHTQILALTVGFKTQLH